VPAGEISNVLAIPGAVCYGERRQHRKYDAAGVGTGERMKRGTHERPDGLDRLIAEHRAGAAVGITSLCTAHAAVLDATLQAATNRDGPVLIEATCNQVNQFGGYTGMNPARFVAYLQAIADGAGFPHARLVLGGDHLGPNPWRHEPAATAMEKARDMVRDYVVAGFSKIHLDASMRCAGDPGSAQTPLPEAVVTDRAADLCQVAEQAADARGGTPPVYIVGTEVPVPGGAREPKDTVTATRVEAARQTIESTREAFKDRGLQRAWQRVIAVVVQPGVEFGDENVAEYQPQAAARLSRLVEGYEGLVYEAHSTDYQPAASLKALVRGHFAILKVGPQLTFAFREAIFGLELIEQELLAGRAAVPASHLRATLESAMLAAPSHWQQHYHGDDAAQRLARCFSYSDRARYYWVDAQVQAALRRLMANLASRPLPMTLLSQFLPREYDAVRQGRLAPSPWQLVNHHITMVVKTYERACTP
jgi:D-tagatose-1,6-bisphosphate aldolase subunit GatZ/KbaZ